jgi:hypothetical protein
MRGAQRKLFAISLLLVAAAWLAPALAADRAAVRLPREFVVPPWDGMRVGLDVLVDGQPLSTFVYAGRTYLPLRQLGNEYEIRVWNHGPRRITAVVSADGLSVLNGKPASEEDPGYLVAPRSSILIKGWRRNVDTVAAFRFEERDKSYASRIGHPENIGVIGLVAFEEWGRVPRPIPQLKESAAATPSRASGDVGTSGTAYGRDIDSPTYEVPFVRSSNRRALTLYYDTIEALRRAGIPVSDPAPVPFPRNHDYVPPPPGDMRR